MLSSDEMATRVGHRIGNPFKAVRFRAERAIVAALLITGLTALLAAAQAGAASLGVMGDSLSDEYEEEAYGSYAENWVEQLEIYAAVDLGQTASEAAQPGGTWAEPRRTQFAYNWARSGADSNSLLSGGQHTGLAASIVNDSVQYAVLAIGANDFYPTGSAYLNIYAGNWSSAQIDSYVNAILANINTALDTVLPTGVELALVNAPDYGVTPAVRAALTDAAGRQRVADAISQLNTGIDSIAQTRQLPVVDFFGASLAIFGTHQSANTTLLIGNVTIHLDQSDTSGGANPTAGFVHDGVHPNTTLQGIFANVIATALNVGYSAGLTIFSEAEILAHRGITYGGSDTLVSQLGDYADYVTNYAAPPTVPLLTVPALGLMGLSLTCTAFAVLRRRR